MNEDTENPEHQQVIGWAAEKTLAAISLNIRQKNKHQSLRHGRIKISVKSKQKVMF